MLVSFAAGADFPNFTSVEVQSVFVMVLLPLLQNDFSRGVGKSEASGHAPARHVAVGDWLYLSGRKCSGSFRAVDNGSKVVAVCRDDSRAGGLRIYGLLFYGLRNPLGRIGRRDEIVALRRPCHRLPLPPLLRRPNCTVVPACGQETTRSVTVLAHRS